jgi:hypothetical protein
MASATRPGFGGLLTALLEVALSVGGYYLLRAFGVDVLWALTVPAAAVGSVAVVVTLRRRRIDMIGLLVIVEIVATITLSLATQSPRIAALREVAYILVGGLFCLATLLRRTPLTHTAAASAASFGDPKRVAAFEHAWADVPKYRRWQRLLTATIGLIMVGACAERAYVLAAAPDAEIAHAVDVSNTIGFAMIASVVVASAVLIQPARKIIEELAAQRA